MSNIRDEIEYSMQCFENVFENSMGFNSRRYYQTEEGYQDLIYEREELQKELTKLQNQKVNCKKELQNLNSNILEVQEYEKNSRQKEVEFMKE